jgi:hypothetical protein
VTDLTGCRLCHPTRMKPHARFDPLLSFVPFCPLESSFKGLVKGGCFMRLARLDLWYPRKELSFVGAMLSRLNGGRPWMSESSCLSD